MKYPISEEFNPYITAVFGQKLWYGKHRGVDFGSKSPDPVIITAPHSGYLTQYFHYQWGKYTEIKTTRFRTILAHNKLLDGWLVEGNRNINKGQAVAVMGNTGWSTGRHLHWQLYDNGIIVDPLNYLDDTPMNMITRVVNTAKKKFSDPSSVFIIVPDVGEYLVINNEKRKITSKTSTKDMEALKNIFGVYVSKEDADKIPSGEDL